MAMMLSRDNRHRIGAVTLLVLVLVGLYGLVDQVVMAKHRFYQENIEQLQDRLKRLNNMLATRQELESKIQQIRQDSSVDGYYLKRAAPTLAATELQQRVKSVVESKGGNLVSTQILPVATDGVFSKVTIRVQMTSDTEALQKVLHELESSEPWLFLDNMQIRARPVRKPRRRRRTKKPPSPTPKQIQLTTRFELAGYMRGGGS